MWSVRPSSQTSHGEPTLAASTTVCSRITCPLARAHPSVRLRYFSLSRVPESHVSVRPRVCPHRSVVIVIFINKIPQRFDAPFRALLSAAAAA